MNKHKSLLLIVLVIFSLGFVSSLSMDVDSPLTQGQQWSISANLSSLNNGENARFYLGSEQIFVVARIDNKFLEVSSSSRVVNSVLDRDNGSLTIVCSGLSAGNYIVELKTSNDSVNANVIFFEPVNKTEKERLESDIAILESEIDKLRTNISDLEKQNQLKDSQINSLINENSELDSSLSLLDSKLRLLEQEGKSKEEIISEIKKDLNELLIEREEARRNPFTGMFAFGAQNSGIILGLLALVLLVIVVVLVKSRNGSIYSNSLFGDDDVAPDFEPVESDESSLNETRISPFKSIFSGLKKKRSVSSDKSKKKKWAVEPYHGGEKSDKKEEQFNLGDLIKKE